MFEPPIPEAVRRSAPLKDGMGTRRKVIADVRYKAHRKQFHTSASDTAVAAPRSNSRQCIMF